jgi:hypothetical protein
VQNSISGARGPVFFEVARSGCGSFLHKNMLCILGCNSVKANWSKFAVDARAPQFGTQEQHKEQ